MARIVPLVACPLVGDHELVEWPDAVAGPPSPGDPLILIDSVVRGQPSTGSGSPWRDQKPEVDRQALRNNRVAAILANPQNL